MCGLAGFLRSGALEADAARTLARMNEALRHRGPDDEGAWLDAERGIALGSRRLSILELSPLGRMPMSSASGRYVAAYNGELYNFAELRSELAGQGAQFRGRSDTEVLLAAIERWGLAQALGRFVGMFALALWDRETRTLALCRDRIGEKPLYWGRCGDAILFGSELKALRAHPAWRGGVDRDALALLLRFGFIPAPYSIHPSVRKVVPGTFLSFRPGASEPEQTRYWSLEAAVAAAGDARATSLEDWSDRLEAALRRTIRDEMVADVPVGAFLSGGIDSSLVAALMQQEGGRAAKTFTIGFPEQEFDESHHARAVARHLGTDHTELIVTPAQALATVPRLHEVYDEPFADSSQIPTVLVSELARSRVTVCLSGDGADELFAGYGRYHLGFAGMETLLALPAPVKRLSAAGVRCMPPGFWNAAARVAAPLLPARLHAPQFEPKLRVVGAMLEARSPQALYRSQLSAWQSPADVVPGAHEPATAYSDPAAWLPGADPISRMMYTDQLVYLPDDILVKVDRASMATSLELRAPFLDHRIVELAWKMPISAKAAHGSGKLVLKRLLARYVPTSLTERPKQGFGVPVAQWLRSALRGWADDLLAPALLAADGLLRPEPVRALWKRHLEAGEDHGTKLWHVLMFQHWLHHGR